jgi:hypothetical protein
MIGDAPTKMRQTNEKTLASLGAVSYCGLTIVKNPTKLIQIPPTIFHPTLESNFDCK